VLEAGDAIAPTSSAMSAQIPHSASARAGLTSGAGPRAVRPAGKPDIIALASIVGLVVVTGLVISGEWVLAVAFAVVAALGLLVLGVAA